MLVPNPTLAAVSFAIASASPVTIFRLTPISRAVAMVVFASVRGGSNSGSTPRNRHAPSPSARATPRERKPRAAKSFTAASTAGSTFVVVPVRARMTWGAPLLTLNVAPPAVVRVTVASVRLWTGSNGWKCVTV